MINTKPQSYADGDTELAGEFFVDTSEPTSARRPGVMLVHGGAGLDDHARQHARRYAELGYVVLACDMFGRGTAGGRREQVIGLRDDPDRLARRARAGLDLLSRVEAHPRAGIFIGGMDDISKECDLLLNRHPKPVIYPLARPGGESAKLMGFAPDSMRDLLSEGNVYPSIFRRIVSDLTHRLLWIYALR